MQLKTPPTVPKNEDSDLFKWLQFFRDDMANMLLELKKLDEKIKEIEKGLKE